MSESNVSESRWISLKSEDIAPDTAPSDAAWARESPSLYDVPTHTRSYYSPESGVFTIQFRYISSEPLKEVKIKPYFLVELGKTSKRIYAIHFYIHDFNRDKQRIAAETRESISAYSGITEPNKDIAVRAITKQQQKLFAAVA